MRSARPISTLAALVVLSTVARGDGPGGDARTQLPRELQDLVRDIDRLKGKTARPGEWGPDRLADAEVFAKGVSWALRHDRTLETADLEALRKALARGRGRVAALEKGEAPWARKAGRVVRGFVSAVDGSVQPYAVIVPGGYDPSRPIRLDVVLHGSTRPVGMSEVRFLARFDDGDDPAGRAPDAAWIELHPLGRVENGYRWAGETDVFEAIEAACRNYAVDRDRIVLRGMSMGASGTWHLGLKHPDRFVALGPYCGYVDTHEFSKTPMPNFVPVGPLPAHQERTLHMLDSVDYAANAGVVPAVACMGEKDPFFQAHEIMGRAMAREGLAIVNLIAPGTGHVIDPATHAEQLRRLGAIAARGLDHAPRHVRFVTWTLKYSRCHWLQVLGMGEHYARAELDARLADEGTIDVAEPRNVTRFALFRPALTAKSKVRVAGVEVPLPGSNDGPGARAIAVGKREGRWAYLGELGAVALEGKRPGLQGPIDDAFTAPFLCVRGTGRPWNPAVQAWSEASLARFATEWDRYFRGTLPVKDDADVTPEDVRDRNLVLFGDPGSNRWIARILPRLPIDWTRESCTIGATRVAAADHAPILIQPNPLAPGRYVVLNRGHTFGEKELSTLNYLLFPRLGDWALARLATDRRGEEIVRAGFFDENWGLSEPRGPGHEP